MKIRQKQKRSRKLKKLRQAYDESNKVTEKNQILDKVAKIAPWLSKEEFLAPLKNKK